MSDGPPGARPPANVRRPTGRQTARQCQTAALDRTPARRPTGVGRPANVRPTADARPSTKVRPNTDARLPTESGTIAKVGQLLEPAAWPTPGRATSGRVTRLGGEPNSERVPEVPWPREFRNCSICPAVGRSTPGDDRGGPATAGEPRFGRNAAEPPDHDAPERPLPLGLTPVMAGVRASERVDGPLSNDDRDGPADMLRLGPVTGLRLTDGPRSSVGPRLNVEPPLRERACAMAPAPRERACATASAPRELDCPATLPPRAASPPPPRPSLARTFVTAKEPPIAKIRIV